jgi:hypothetical protein
MTKKNIINNVEKWQEIFGLQDWHFVIDPVGNTYVSADSCDLARCVVLEDEMVVHIALATDMPDFEIEKSIRHEESHVMLHDLRCVFEDAASLLGAEAKTALMRRYEKSEEKLVIKLERIIDSFLQQLDDAAKK